MNALNHEDTQNMKSMKISICLWPNTNNNNQVFVVYFVIYVVNYRGTYSFYLLTRLLHLIINIRNIFFYECGVFSPLSDL